MSWADDKASLKATVHNTFALPALYTRASDGPGVVSPLPVGARYNSDIRMIGGQSSNGFAQIIQDVPKLRIDSAELVDPITLEMFSPKQDDLIAIPSEGATFRVNNILPMDGKYFVLEVESFGVA